MSKCVGVLTSIVAIVVSLTGVEVGLRYLAPVPDPLNKITYTSHIASQFAPNSRLYTQQEVGLPGMSGRNLFSTNNVGYRGDYLAMPKPPNEFRIFIVGGSSTECFYLDDAQAIHSVLQRQLNEHVRRPTVVKVYNAGKAGDRSDDHVSMIVHRIVHLQPDMIIVFAGINDLLASMAEYDYLHLFSSPHERLSLSRLLQMTATEFQIPRRVYYLLSRHRPITERQAFEEVNSTLRVTERAKRRAATPITDRRPRTDLIPYENNLRTIAGVAKAHRTRLIFMTQQTTWNSSVDPEVSKWQWMLYRLSLRIGVRAVTYRADYADAALESLNDVTRGVALEEGAALYDLAKVMPKSSEFFYDDVHFNVKGAYAAGTGLASLIQKNGLAAYAQR